ncbi:spermidine synthase [Couchioplanes caeruleus]|uniref:spermidine synthase n=1 Tax=Couchioplanes caeruleus TaxID=56438 RepID=UPI0020BF5CA4|nr:spermidine synthase [Couchioplanes caeruleus]UQU61820.1 spermidine synthase [Couchioplanes caeruleus]
MSLRFEELAWRETPMGEISLRRRRDPMLGIEVYEVKLGDEFLMSSLFTVAEIELARLGLDEVTEPAGLDVVVGGLGLGYTARTVLDDPRVRSLVVVDAIEEVISWHRRGLLPFAGAVATDPRCRLVHADFFALTADPAGYDPATPGRQVHVVLLDIDHSPSHLLNPGHAAFYTADGLRRLAAHLHPGGVFGLWSNDPPDDAFTALLGEVFATARAEVVAFPNPLQGRTSTNTVYVARTPGV